MEKNERKRSISCDDQREEKKKLQKSDEDEPEEQKRLFDKKLFEEVLNLTSVEVPVSETQSIFGRLKGFLFKRKDLKNYPFLLKEENKSIFLLDSSISLDLSELPPDLRDHLKSIGAKIAVRSVTIGFDDKSIESILRSFLPSEIKTITTKYETVGHIGHVNLRGHEEPYKYLIGAVLLEKNKPRLRTIINKVGAIENTFRVLPMEIIAGDKDTIVTLKESGCTFRFDFSQVFWNSRLENEHLRIIKICNKGEVVCDIFAGVGPFSVPLCRKGCIVYCNDLNPYCYKALIENAENNLGKKKLENFKAYNLDARDFIKMILEKEDVIANHFLMNLPMTSHLFLDAFIGSIPSRYTVMPMIHCYCFSNAPAKHKQLVIEKIESVLGAKIDIKSCFKIRQTASQTKEYAISFLLPESVGRPQKS